jgi:subtilisin family serine protease
VPQEQTFASIKQLQQDPNVRYVEKDQTLHTTGVPNDPLWLTLWNMDTIGLASAWDLSLPSDAPIVAVIDTGIYFPHPEFKGMLWTNTGEIAGNGIDDDHNGIVDDVNGASFLDGVASGDPSDLVGHGTHIAGIIAAKSNNGVGVAGIAPTARIMPLRFINAKGQGKLSDVLSAIDYAISHGAKVLNNSWGGGGYSQALSDLITRAKDAGDLFVVAAGNDSKNIDTIPSYPAAYPQDNVISVAATDMNDGLAAFSNYGANNVDIGAPGVTVVSTWLSGIPPWVPSPTGTYNWASGTSMAAPHVSGAAAWLWSVRPDSSWSQIKQAILSGSQPVSSLSGRTTSGARLYLPGAFNFLVDPSHSTPAPNPKPGRPRNLIAPLITLSGTTAVCSNGSWVAPAPKKYTYNWYSGEAQIPSSSKNTYSVQTYDWSKPLTCSVTVYAPDGSPVTVASKTLTVPFPQPTVRPKISGKVGLGLKLTVSNGQWLYNPTLFEYQWYRDGTAITDATSSTYTMVAGDRGHVLSCMVGATNLGGRAIVFSDQAFGRF